MTRGLTLVAGTGQDDELLLGQISNGAGRGARFPDLIRSKSPGTKEGQSPVEHEGVIHSHDFESDYFS